MYIVIFIDAIGDDMNSKNLDSGGKKGVNASSCTSRFTCTPCLFIWGTVLIVMIVQYFVR